MMESRAAELPERWVLAPLTGMMECDELCAQQLKPLQSKGKRSGIVNPASNVSSRSKAITNWPVHPDPDRPVHQPF